MAGWEPAAGQLAIMRVSERGDMHRGEVLMTESWVSTWVADGVVMLPDGPTGAAIGIVSLGVAGEVMAGRYCREIANVGLMGGV